MIPLFIEQHSPKIFSSRCISDLNHFKTEVAQSCKLFDFYTYTYDKMNNACQLQMLNSRSDQLIPLH